MTDPDELARVLFDEYPTAAVRVAFVPPRNTRRMFDAWAMAAFAWVQLADGTAVVAEELADVTVQGKAPGGWGTLIRRGLKYGADIYAISQRPQEMDKTTIGNSSVLHTHALHRADDRAYIAREMDIPLPDVEALDDLEYLERDVRTRAYTRSRLTF